VYKTGLIAVVLVARCILRDACLDWSLQKERSAECVATHSVNPPTHQIRGQTSFFNTRCLAKALPLLIEAVPALEIGEPAVTERGIEAIAAKRNALLPSQPHH
jgi:hypothetical protein